MSDFEDYVYEEFVRQMRSWPLEVRNDIYVIVIYIALVDDDPRLPLLNMNYNTLPKWQAFVSQGENEQEAKWNPAFWGIDDQSWLCWPAKYNYHQLDLKGIELRDNYLKAQLPQYDFSDVEQKALLAGANALSFAYQNSLVNAVVDLCGSVVQRLHESSVITDICGRAVPVGIEMLNDTGNASYCSAKIEATNPAGLTEEYVKWRREVL